MSKQPKKKQFSNSQRKYIRKEKARIRREILDVKEQEKLIDELYKPKKKEVKKPLKKGKSSAGKAKKQDAGKKQKEKKEKGKDKDKKKKKNKKK